MPPTEGQSPRTSLLQSILGPGECKKSVLISALIYVFQMCAPFQGNVFFAVHCYTRAPPLCLAV